MVETRDREIYIKRVEKNKTLKRYKGAKSTLVSEHQCDCCIGLKVRTHERTMCGLATSLVLQNHYQDGLCAAKKHLLHAALKINM